jgi:hypothetical protein
MPLLRLSEAFDHPDWLFELKHDGFRALAVVELCRARFISRQGYEFKQWPQLSEELSHTIRARRAVLDGEIVCLRPDGLSDFYSLMFRRGSPYFYAFDLLELDGRTSASGRCSSGNAGWPRSSLSISRHDYGFSDTSRVAGATSSVWSATMMPRASWRSGAAAHTTSMAGRRPG